MIPGTYKFFECLRLFDGLAMNCECQHESQSLIDDLPPVDSAGTLTEGGCSMTMQLAMWHLMPPALHQQCTCRLSRYSQ